MALVKIRVDRKFDRGEADETIATCIGLKRGSRTGTRLMAAFAVTATALALTACGQGNDKAYDIAPIFPLTSNKCAKYDGKAEGAGFTAHCWVTKAKCEQAASDWRIAMRNVPNAIKFTC